MAQTEIQPNYAGNPVFTLFIMPRFFSKQRYPEKPEIQGSHFEIRNNIKILIPEFSER